MKINSLDVIIKPTVTPYTSWLHHCHRGRWLHMSNVYCSAITIKIQLISYQKQQKNCMAWIGTNRDVINMF